MQVQTAAPQQIIDRVRQIEESMVSPGNASPQHFGDGILLALHVMLQLSQPSHAKAYWQMLPTSVSTPFYWPEDTMEMATKRLSNTLSEGLLVEHSARVQSYQMLHQNVFGEAGSEASFNQIVHALSLIRSRGLSREGSPPSLVPVLDLFNHSPTHNVAHSLDPATECWQLTAVRPVESGEQLYISYGELCNSQLLQQYGFVIPSNEYDKLMVPWHHVAASCARQNISQQPLWWQDQGGTTAVKKLVGSEGVSLHAATADAGATQLIGACHLCTLTAKQLEERSSNPTQMLPEEEVTAVARALQLCRNALADYKELPEATPQDGDFEEGQIVELERGHKTIVKLSIGVLEQVAASLPVAKPG